MVDHDLVYGKVDSIKTCLSRIRDVTHLDAGSLDDIDAQDIFVLNLQRAVQSTLDLASHIVASEGLGLPENLKDNFILLRQASIIDEKLSQKMSKMVGFRNIAVHEYQAIDIDMLKSILLHHLEDFEAFYLAILQHFKLSINKQANDK